MNEYERLKVWREERNIDQMTPTKSQIVEHFVEELFEMCGYDKKEVHILTKRFMSYYVQEKRLDAKVMLDAMNDMAIFKTNDSELLGYDAQQCMDETLKEVESRKGEYNADSGKWIKVITGNEYTADYGKCKR